MPEFTIYVSWRPSVQEPHTLLDGFAATLETTDTNTCVWVDDRRPALVQLSFDLDAEDYEPAIEQARRLVADGAATQGLSGVTTEVTAMTEEGQVRWSE